MAFPLGRDLMRIISGLESKAAAILKANQDLAERIESLRDALADQQNKTDALYSSVETARDLLNEGKTVQAHRELEQTLEFLL